MNSVANVFDGDSVSQNDPIFEIRRTAGLFRVDSDEIQVLPQKVQHVVQVELD